MSLMFGTGPFGRGTGQFSFGSTPENLWYVEDWPRRMRAVFAGETILDSCAGKVIHERNRLPAHYFPQADLRADVLVPEEQRRWSLAVGDRIAERVVKARDDVEALQGYVTIKYDAMDYWFEEDEPIYGHPRDPYHRIDVRTSSRHVIVRKGDEVVAESNRPKLLFETANPVRYYMPWRDVRPDLLHKSETVSVCPYKGETQHWHLQTGGSLIHDAAWSLPHPLPEGLAAAQHVSFYADKVDIDVDGQRIDETGGR